MDSSPSLAPNAASATPPDTPANPAVPAAPLAADIPRIKSPPLAFEKTPNDSLGYFTFSSATRHENAQALEASSSLSPPHAMGVLSPTAGFNPLQTLVDQQANAIHLLHSAFTAERKVWGLERESMMLRIASLEQLLKTGDHHSPAKSPILSPAMTSPQSRSMSNAPRLPSIAEDENHSLPRRTADDTSAVQPPLSPEPERRRSSVAFSCEPASLMVGEEDPSAPHATQQASSPVPMSNRMLAGHTPLKFSRPPTPPPSKMSMEGIEDTPTRTNTHINSFLTQTNDDDEELSLRGPLNLPELPTRPDANNFTLDALSMRLQQLKEHPESSTPMVIAHPSPGFVSPANGPETGVLSQQERAMVGGIEPTCTRTFDSHHSHSGRSSNLSPNNGVPHPHQEAREQQVQSAFEQGGIKLKKKPSTNFGAPFGQLGGFARM